MSEKAKTIKKWTSNSEYRNNFDKVFKKQEKGGEEVPHPKPIQIPSPVESTDR